MNLVGILNDLFENVKSQFYLKTRVYSAKLSDKNNSKLRATIFFFPLKYQSERWLLANQFVDNKLLLIFKINVCFHFRIHFLSISIQIMCKFTIKFVGRFKKRIIWFHFLAYLLSIYVQDKCKSTIKYIEPTCGFHIFNDIFTKTYV